MNVIKNKIDYFVYWYCISSIAHLGRNQYPQPVNYLT